jgi:hypothetical protein
MKNSFEAMLLVLIYIILKTEQHPKSRIMVGSNKRM